ncbi:MAG: radical SAM protein [Pseudomonadota bacterium]
MDPSCNGNRWDSFIGFETNFLKMNQMKKPYQLKELCLEVTNSCPMHCKHCSTRSVRLGTGSPLHMPISVAKKVVDDLATLGGRILEISGGEPLIYPDLLQLCRHAAGLGIEVRIYTSGILVDQRGILQRIAASQLELLKQCGVTKIIFNLQGASSKSHQQIMGVTGTHRLVIEAIRTAKEKGFWVGVHFVPMKPNFRELPHVVSLCSSLEVDELALLRFVPQGRGEENRDWLELNLDEFDELFRSVVDLKRQHSNLNIRAGCPMDFLSLYDSEISPHSCKAGRCTCAIAPSGQVVPCPAFKNSPEFTAGNIYQQSLIEIWDNAFQNLRELQYKKISEPCRRCKVLDDCRGRCVAQRHILYGNIYEGPDPACPKLLDQQMSDKNDHQTFNLAANLTGQ